MGRTNYDISQATFIADLESIDYSTGYAINWDAVTNTDGEGNKFLPAGKIVSVRDGGIFNRDAADVAAAPDETAAGILLEGIAQGDKNRAQNGQAVIVGGVIYRDLLPDSDNADFDAMVGELEDLGRGFHWEPYADNRA